MKVLIADSIDETAVQQLEAAGDEVVLSPDLTAETLPDRIGDAEVLVVRSTLVTPAVIDAGKKLALIVRAGAGVNTIDTEHAAANAVLVANVPGRNAIAVAELAFGLMLAIDRHIADATADLRVGTWNKKAHGRARGLYESTLGIIGLGEIGMALAERAVGFGMRVVAERKDRPRAVQERTRQLGIELLPDRDHLLDESDIVSIHVPGNPSTHHLVDAEFLARMKDGAVLINTSRGDVVDPDALIEAMDRRGIRCGLDVYPDEPAGGAGSIDSALARHPNVVGTHHIGASTDQAQRSVAEGTVEVIDSYRRNEIEHCVNLEVAPERTCTLTVRHFDRVGVLASVLDILRAADLNVSNMRNRIFAGSLAAMATIDVAGPVDAKILAEIEANPDVIAVVMNT
jgi:D-3-phosphoglycerate dehydrogenase